jgi:hypothetical protein
MQAGRDKPCPYRFEVRFKLFLSRLAHEGVNAVSSLNIENNGSTKACQ